MRPRGESASRPHKRYVGHVGRQNPQCTHSSIRSRLGGCSWSQMLKGLTVLEPAQAVQRPWWPMRGLPWLRILMLQVEYYGFETDVDTVASRPRFADRDRPRAGVESRPAERQLTG